MTSPAVDVEAVRAAAREALGDDRLRHVGADEPLLHAGIVTSIEMVALLVGLEGSFQVSLPAAAVAAGNVSLRSLADAVAGALAGGAAPIPSEAGNAAAAGGRREIAAFVLAALLGLVAIDRAVGSLLEGPLRPAHDAFLEGGRRLYPWSGRFSHDDFAHAMTHHRLRTAPPASPSWLVLGDSGTIGSFVAAEEAIPARLEAALRRAGAGPRVENLAWFGRLLAKDLMLLELAWDADIGAVVFTLGPDHFRRHQVDRWIRRYRHCSVNWPLFAAFTERVPAAEREPFRDVLGQLAAADARQRGALRRFAFAHLRVFHAAPYLQYLLAVRLLPPGAHSPMRRDAQEVRNERFAVTSPPRPATGAVPRDEIDPRQVEMLATTLRMLRARGARSVLFVEPCAPAAWRVPAPAGSSTPAEIVRDLARDTGATVVDLSWSLDRGDFIDSEAHYTPEANDRLARAIADAVVGEVSPGR